MPESAPHELRTTCTATPAIRSRTYVDALDCFLCNCDTTETTVIRRRPWIGDIGLVSMLAVAVAVRLPRTWTVLGDNALMRMWTDAVGTVNTPLVGGDARFGWNHLGPWIFYLMAIPYRLMGRSAVGLLVGAALINVVSFVATLRCVRSLAGQRVARVVASCTLIFIVTAQGDRLLDPWNPYVVQMPFLLSLVTCWAVLNRRWQWLPWLVGAGSLCVQGHITFIAPVAVFFVAAAVSVARAPRLETRTAVRRSGLVAIIAWLPAAVDLFMPQGHNLYRVARFFVQPSKAPTSGISGGLRVVLHETGLGSSWLGGHIGLRLFSDAFDGGLGLLPGVGIIALVAAGLASRRRQDAALGSLVLLLSMLLPVAVVEMALGRGPLYPYLFGWVTLVGMMCWVAGLMAMLPLLNQRVLDKALTAGVVFLALTLVFTGVNAGLPRSPRERPQDAGIVRELVAQTERGLVRSTDYQLAHGNDNFSSIYEMGVIDSLRNNGYRISVEPSGRVLFGRHMTNTLACSYPVLSVIAQFESADAGDRIIALSDPLSAAERAHEADLVAMLIGRYSNDGWPDVADIIRFAEGNQVLVADAIHPDPALRPRVRELAVLRSRGRSIAVTVRDASAADHCDRPPAALADEQERAIPVSNR